MGRPISYGEVSAYPNVQYKPSRKASHASLAPNCAAFAKMEKRVTDAQLFRQWKEVNALKYVHLSTTLTMASARNARKDASTVLQVTLAGNVKMDLSSKTKNAPRTAFQAISWTEDIAPSAEFQIASNAQVSRPASNAQPTSPSTKANVSLLTIATRPVWSVQVQPVSTVSSAKRVPAYDLTVPSESVYQPISGRLQCLTHAVIAIYPATSASCPPRPSPKIPSG
jgi:hypothetical protein